MSSADCLLYKLPLEIRMEIYRRVFDTTILRYGSLITRGRRRRPGQSPVSQIMIGPVWVPPADALALLYVCKQINVEIGKDWISQVVYQFRDMHSALDLLDRLPESIIRKIRHIWIRHSAFGWSFITPRAASGYMTVGPSIMFWFLPLLQLETYVVQLDCERSALRDTRRYLEELLDLPGPFKTLAVVFHGAIHQINEIFAILDSFQQTRPNDSSLSYSAERSPINMDLNKFTWTDWDFPHADIEHAQMYRLLAVIHKKGEFVSPWASKEPDWAAELRELVPNNAYSNASYLPLLPPGAKETARQHARVTNSIMYEEQSQVYGLLYGSKKSSFRSGGDQ